jgi:hypothetical protein
LSSSGGVCYDDRAFVAARDGAIVVFPLEGTPLNAQVLVLNQNYEPLNI